MYCRSYIDYQRHRKNGGKGGQLILNDGKRSAESASEGISLANLPGFASGKVEISSGGSSDKSDAVTISPSDTH